MAKMKTLTKIALGAAAVLGLTALFSKGPGERAKKGDVVDVPLSKLDAAGLPELLTRLRAEQPNLTGFGVRVDGESASEITGPIVEMILAPNNAHIALAGIPGGIGPIPVRRADVTAVRVAS